MLFDNNESRRIVFAMAVHSSMSILGPMLFFGVLGYFLDKYFGTKPKMLLINIGVAFIFSNVLLFSNQRRIIKKLNIKNKKNIIEDKNNL